MICRQRDPVGWVPFCGQEFDPCTRWSICPHPPVSLPCPTASEHYKSAVDAGWRSPDTKPRSGAHGSLTALVDRLGMHLGVYPEDLRGPSRCHPLVEHRQVVMSAARRITGASFPVLGDELDRDHTTVMHGCQRVESSPRLREMADRLVLTVSAT